jgi:hypothetical protein
MYGKANSCMNEVCLRSLISFYAPEGGPFFCTSGSNGANIECGNALYNYAGIRCVDKFGPCSLSLRLTVETLAGIFAGQHILSTTVFFAASLDPPVLVATKQMKRGRSSPYTVVYKKEREGLHPRIMNQAGNYEYSNAPQMRAKLLAYANNVSWNGEQRQEEAHCYNPLSAATSGAARTIRPW